MRRRDLLRTVGVRRVLGSAAILGLSLMLMAGFIWWQTVGYFTERLDRFLLDDIEVNARRAPAEVRAHIEQALASDLRGTRAYALIDSAGRIRLGNIRRLPEPLPPPDRVLAATVPAEHAGTVRALPVRLTSAPSRTARGSSSPAAPSRCRTSAKF